MTDDVIRGAVLNHWSIGPNIIKVSVVDSASVGDTDACSEAHVYLNGNETAVFNGTQYTIEIMNGPSSGTLLPEVF